MAASCSRPMSVAAVATVSSPFSRGKGSGAETLLPRALPRVRVDVAGWDAAHPATNRAPTVRQQTRAPFGQGPARLVMERRGPVAQPVFKTGQAWQPHAG